MFYGALRGAPLFVGGILFQNSAGEFPEISKFLFISLEILLDAFIIIRASKFTRIS